MTDINIGHMMRTDISAVPKSALLYACAGFAGAIGITAIELATKIDIPLPRPTPPVTENSDTAQASPSPELQSIFHIDAPTAKVAFRDGLDQFRKQMATQSKATAFALAPIQRMPNGVQPSLTSGASFDELKLMVLRIAMPSAITMEGPSTFGQVSREWYVGDDIGKPLDTRSPDRMRTGPITSGLQQPIPALRSPTPGRAANAPSPE